MQSQLATIYATLKVLIHPVYVILDCILFLNATPQHLIYLQSTHQECAKSVDIFWSYLNNNLILIIETPFTQARQAYSIQLEAQIVNSEMVDVYEVSETGVRTKLKPKNDRITIQSNANYQVILEFQVITTLMTYGIPIRYDVVNNETYSK